LPKEKQMNLINELKTPWPADFSLQPINSKERLEVVAIQQLKNQAANEILRKNKALSIAIHTLLMAVKNGLITETIWIEKAWNEPPETLIDLLEKALDDPAIQSQTNTQKPA
jgi:hypothetical protein